MTRYPTEIVFEGEAYVDKIHNNGTAELYNLLQEKDSCDAIDYGFGATEDLISSIIANRKRKLIDLPLRNITKLYYFNKKWKIS